MNQTASETVVTTTPTTACTGGSSSPSSSVHCVSTASPTMSSSSSPLSLTVSAETATDSVTMDDTTENKNDGSTTKSNNATTTTTITTTTNNNNNNNGSSNTISNNTRTRPSSIQDITIHDVLCGRGRAVRLHPGNVMYNQLLRDSYQQYSQTKKGKKVEIVKHIASIVTEKGGRFLEKVSLSSLFYTEMEEDKILAKIAQGYRDLRVTSVRSSINSSSTTTTSRQRQSSQHHHPHHDRMTTDADADSDLEDDSVGPIDSVMPRKGVVSTSSAAVGTAAASSLRLQNVKTISNSGDGNNTIIPSLPGQPRRLTFTERMKLWQKEQEILMRLHHRSNTLGSSDESGSEEEYEEDDDDDHQNNMDGEDDSDTEDEDDEEEENNETGTTPKDPKVVDKVATPSLQGRYSPSTGDMASSGDVSETETEDSFPMYRRNNGGKSRERTTTKG